jgi:hypothetical protein
MKTLDTLIEDIYAVFDKDVTVPPEEIQAFGDNLARTLSDKLTKQEPRLRLSNVGSPCRRRLWYSIRCPELGEKLSGPARIKFLIGDITEAVIIFLAKLAGHCVRDEQQTVEVHGIQGHLDGTIDGEVVDVKSASPASFKKFQKGLSRETDGFGYLSQIGGYAQAKGKNNGHFLAVDKVLGTLHIDSHSNLPVISPDHAQEIRNLLDQDTPPDRGFTDEKQGESGNRALGFVCSYCEFKHRCWPGLQVYPYVKGPVYFTKVVKEPVLRGKRDQGPG